MKILRLLTFRDLESRSSRPSLAFLFFSLAPGAPDSALASLALLAGRSFSFSICAEGFVAARVSIGCVFKVVSREQLRKAQDTYC